MLAYSAQDLVVEPFGGAVFGLSLGETTRLASVQHAGVLLGMVAVALAGSMRASDRTGRLRRLAVGGCVGAALSVLGLGALGLFAEARPLAAACFAVGVGDGVFAAAAIASMMHLAGRDGEGRAGLRMGVWGAAQAVAFGSGGLVGTAAVDAARYALGAPPALAYGLVFAADALLFLWAALLALRVGRSCAAPEAAEGDARHSRPADLGARLA
jgi:BCD family chlorophyll transporter-like MFS transporter